MSFEYSGEKVLPDSKSAAKSAFSYLNVSLVLNGLFVLILTYSYISSQQIYSSKSTVIPSSEGKFPNVVPLYLRPSYAMNERRTKKRNLEELNPASTSVTHETYKYWHVSHARAPRKIIIDLGANEGDSIAHFLNPVEEKNGQFSDGSELLKGHCGDGSWEIVVFEANPIFNDILTQKKEFYERNHTVTKFHLYNGTAISTKTGTVTFVLDNNANSYSSSISSDTKNYHGVDGMGSVRIEIPTVGIEDLFARLEILPKDFVILKVDVEGYEYELMRHIYATGLHILIDTLAVEWHNAGFVDEVREMYSCYQRALIWLGSDVPGMNQLDWH